MPSILDDDLDVHRLSISDDAQSCLREQHRRLGWASVACIFGLFFATILTLVLCIGGINAKYWLFFDALAFGLVIGALALLLRKTRRYEQALGLFSNYPKERLGVWQARRDFWYGVMLFWLALFFAIGVSFLTHKIQQNKGITIEEPTSVTPIPATLPLDTALQNSTRRRMEEDLKAMSTEQQARIQELIEQGNEIKRSMGWDTVPMPQ